MVTTWLVIVILACIPPYLNKVHVVEQLRKEAMRLRIERRRETIRRILNDINNTGD